MDVGQLQFIRANARMIMTTLRFENDGFQSMTDYGTLYVSIKNVEDFSGFGSVSLTNCTRGVAINGAPTQSVSLEKK